MSQKMTLTRYRELKAQPPVMPRQRLLCSVCLQPHSTCYCAHLRSFDPKIKFAILIHPIEVRRRIATGRMSHLLLRDSFLIHGCDYTDNPQVNELLHDSRYHSVILYPGLKACNLSQLEAPARAQLFPPDKELLIFVIDGTWSTARKMLNRSRNLQTLPRICFTPTKPSQFRVRQQPKVECYSTIEAIHHTLELLGPARGFNLASGEHNRLLDVFGVMVEQQLEFIRVSHSAHRGSRHRRRANP